MSSMDLVQFLRDRLDEDETLARNTGQWGMSWQNLTMDGELRDDANAGTVAHIPHEATRAHIARHDPARVLREVDAKRKLVDQYAEAADNDVDEPYEYAYGWANGLGVAARLLALPYADHPDYREEWRP
ncbi:DUF6221 family protein [Streptomyces sp. ML-6]|uniref:DUF6221 family protein n=1 Tax=Streptomyces sp. ML-6 TaxID=2982693 RepID=UPI0024BF99E3|nr:DUF6221 family protein [Streptomyces sp. ML-6]MDK0520377.1 DUF6221 family protein [Streptomyces sp. ML-6]